MNAWELPIMATVFTARTGFDNLKENRTLFKWSLKNTKQRMTSNWLIDSRMLYGSYPMKLNLHAKLVLQEFACMSYFVCEWRHFVLTISCHQLRKFIYYLSLTHSYNVNYKYLVLFFITRFEWNLWQLSSIYCDICFN